MIKCPNCTAQITYKVTDKVVKCDYCGGTFSPEELNATYNVADENVTKESVSVSGEIDATSYNCDNCGATLLVYDDTAVTFCNYCGSSNMIKSKLIKQTKPDFIIPFEIDKEKCIELYKKKIKRNIFAPKYMLDDVTVSNFRGIYMPYVIYNYKANPNFAAEGLKYSHHIGNYDYYDIYTVTADLDGYVNGIAFDGVSKFYDKYSQAIAPYDYSKVKDFNPTYISGFYADSLDISNKIYALEAMKTATKASTHFLAKDKRFARYGCTAPKAKMEQAEQKIAMYPVYFLGIRDKKNEKIHYAVINGQTGKVAIDIPIDFKKYVFFSLLLACLLFFIVQFILSSGFIYMTVFVPLYFAIAASIGTIIVSAIISSKLDEHQTLENDDGYVSKNKEEVKMNIAKVNKFAILLTLIKPIIALILPLIIIFSNIALDVYFYGAALVSCLLILLTFYDIVIQYNKLSKNKIPQFNKRGGDK